MFDHAMATDSSRFRAVDPSAWIESLAVHDGHDLTDTERIDQISELERLKAAAAAAQARITEAFDRSQRQAPPPSSAPARSPAASPHRSRWLGASHPRAVSSMSASPSA
jgi:hypothetical protein